MPRQARSSRSSSWRDSGVVLVVTAMGVTTFERATTLAAGPAMCGIVVRATILETTMALEGLHHVTAITGDAPRNVDFYARLLGLRLVKKTVNFDQPDVYHLYFGDERGTPGSILTFFEFPDAAKGRAGDGMIHTVQWRIRSMGALGFWERRLKGQGRATAREGDELLRFADPEGLTQELLAVAVDDAPLAAQAPGIPAEHALQGFEGVRAYAADPSRSTGLLQALGFGAAEAPGAWIVGGDERHAHLHYDVPPSERGIQSAGTVHHVAWSA